MCGEICELDSDDSDAAMTYCTLPPLISEFSISEYELAKHEILTIEWTDEDENIVTELNDGDLSYDYESGSGDRPCSVYGEHAGEDHQYLLSEFRFYVGEVRIHRGKPHVAGLRF